MKTLTFLKLLKFGMPIIFRFRLSPGHIVGCGVWPQSQSVMPSPSMIPPAEEDVGFSNGIVLVAVSQSVNILVVPPATKRDLMLQTQSILLH